MHGGTANCCARLGGLILALAMLSPAGARAQGLPAVGDGQGLWVLRIEDHGTEVLHRRLLDPSGTLQALGDMSGEPAPGGWACAGNTLWVVFDNLAVQSLRLTEQEEGGRGALSSIEAALPQGLGLVSAAADATGLWALVRADRPAVLAAIEALPAEDTPADGAASAPTSAPGPAAPAATRPADPPSRTPVPATRLLHLRRGRWVRVDLPVDWAHNAPAWVVAGSGLADPPALVLSPRGEDRPLIVYRPATPAATPSHPRQWRRQEYALPVSGARRPVVVEGQLLVGWRTGAADRLEVSLALLGPKGATVLGALALDQIGHDVPWTLASYGQHAALLARPAPGQIAWVRMDLRGETSGPPSELTVETPSVMTPALENALLLGVLVLATLIMFVYWRRDGMASQVRLPRNLVLAGPAPRALAGVIDLAPCIALVAVLAGQSLPELLQRWPTWAGAWTVLWPKALVVGLFIAHSLLGELIAGRSLGKTLMGLRVVTLDGQRPRPWQVLVRNLLKTLDLVAFPLLILALIGPNRQRLGDLVARTIVVAPAPPPQPADHDDDAE